MAKNQYPVWFNDEHKNLYNKIKGQGLTTRSFQDFVKDSFFKALEEKNISIITQNKIMELSK